MALRRCTRSVDGTIPIPALLYDDEELLASQENVGIYDGPQKSPSHQAGTVHVSTHRLFYIDVQNDFSHSFALDLSYVTQTEYYAGLFKSSPKVTLHLSATKFPALRSGANEDWEVASESWECEVCAYRNPPGLSPAAARICALCGVPRSAVLVPATPVPTHHFSSSLPTSSPVSALSSSTSLPVRSGSHHEPPGTIACPACTYLNRASRRTCEICSTPIPFEATQSRLGMKSAPSSRPISPDSYDDPPTNLSMRLSFRKGGDKAFYAVLKRSLKSKVWEASGIGSPIRRETSSAGATSDGRTIGRSGITGILRTVEASAHSTETDMKDALKDLEALMVKAKDMVRLASELNERLTASSTTATTSSPSPTSSNTALVPSTEPEEATFIRSSLSQLGLQMSNTPVTQDMMKDERKWIEELARELAKVLQGNSMDSRVGRGTGMMGERGILALDEVWGGWNRARGVALIPPSTFLTVIPHLSAYTNPPIRTRTFTSGLSVLHTPPYTHAAFAARLSGLLALAGPKTTMEVAQEERITVSLAGEMIGAVEGDGHVCRDDGSAMIKGGGSGGGAELRWWANIFTKYIWDGEV